MNQILHDDWNPIGVGNMPADEYSSYAGTVGRLLGEGASAGAIAAYLGEAREYMGVDADADHDRVIADRLYDVYPS